MRVLVVDQFSDLGGAQNCLLQLLPAMTERGWTVSAALPGNGPLTRSLPSTEICCRPYGRGTKSLGDALHFLFDIRNQQRTISDLIDKGRVDLVVVNGPRVLPGVALAAQRRVPVLFHAHNYLDRSWAARIAGMSIRRGVHSVVACSEFVAAPFRTYLRDGQVHVITNASKDMGFRERGFEQPWRIGLIGRIARQKGQVDLIRAARQLPPTRIVLCGGPAAEAPDYYEESLNLARGLDVEFTGYREDIDAVLAELDFLVIPSEHEGLPLVMLEAFSAGVIVIAYPTGGVTEVITDGQNGFLTPECSAEGIVSVVRHLLSASPAELHRVARKARHVWEARHTTRTFQQRMLALMQQTAFGTADPQHSR